MRSAQIAHCGDDTRRDRRGLRTRTARRGARHRAARPMPSLVHGLMPASSCGGPPETASSFTDVMSARAVVCKECDESRMMSPSARRVYVYTARQLALLGSARPAAFKLAADCRGQTDAGKPSPVRLSGCQALVLYMQYYARNPLLMPNARNPHSGSRPQLLFVLPSAMAMVRHQMSRVSTFAERIKRCNSNQPALRQETRIHARP